jgi:hypothetical protein
MATLVKVVVNKLYLKKLVTRKYLNNFLMTRLSNLFFDIMVVAGVAAIRIEALEKLDNCICFFPEWVYNGDGGVSSVFYGFEMGQHCMINWIQHNLMFDSGKPADTRIPNGVTGWIKNVCEIK